MFIYLFVCLIELCLLKSLFFHPPLHTELERAQGMLPPESGISIDQPKKSEEDEEDEFRESDAKDDEETYKARAMDEYKDEHKRGEGNRYNKG